MEPEDYTYLPDGYDYLGELMEALASASRRMNG